MRILAVSDIHGDLRSVREAVARFRPAALVSCGDWRDPDEIDERLLEEIVGELPVATTFGNHDPVDLLVRLMNRNGTPVLIGQGEVRDFGGIRLAAIGGIWAKSHRMPYHVTDEDVKAYAAKAAFSAPVDILLTHGCPVGLADLTENGRRGGHRCFLDAFNAMKPRLHLCGHVHIPQERLLKDGRKVINVGRTSLGSVAVVETGGVELMSRLETFTRESSDAAANSG